MTGLRRRGPVLIAPVTGNPDPHPALDRIDLLSPMVGVWQDLVAPGQLIQSGELIGLLTVLGVDHQVVAGPGVRGAGGVLADFGLTEEQGNQIIMAARAHWFADEPASGEVAPADDSQ